VAALVPPAIQTVIGDLISGIVSTQSVALLTLGAVFALFGATAGIGTLIKGLDRALKSPNNRPFWKGLLVAMAAAIILDTIMLAGFLVNAFGQWALDSLPADHQFTQILARILDVTSDPVMVFGLAGALWLAYFTLPTVRPHPAYAAAGALVAA